MKVCLVSFVSPYAIPYINIYLNKIKEKNIECDVLYWDRDGDAVEERVKNIHYVPYSTLALQSQSRIIRYLKYIPVTNYIRNRIKKEKYDRIIFLQTHAAIACYDILSKNYKGKYIVDIRDFTLENFSLFKIIEARTIKNSYQTVISSRGYTAFLPEHEYIIAHNYTPIDKNRLVLKQKKTKNINISFIGYVRFYPMAKKILSLFANDNRFHVSYIGKGANGLKKYCQENGIKNITLIDKFEPNETEKFYLDCDMVNNLYGNRSNYLDYALANKLYYGAQFKIPVLVSPDTYSSEVANKYNLGISWNPYEEDSVDKLYNKYLNFDNEKMITLSEKFLENVVLENSKFEIMIDKFLMGK